MCSSVQCFNYTDWQTNKHCLPKKHIIVWKASGKLRDSGERTPTAIDLMQYKQNQTFSMETSGTKTWHGNSATSEVKMLHCFNKSTLYDSSHYSDCTTRDRDLIVSLYVM